MEDGVKQKQDFKNTTCDWNGTSSSEYFSFFNFAPIPIWIEDFSEAKKFIEEKALELNEDVITLLNDDNNILNEVVSLVKIKEVNDTAIRLYNAKNKADLLSNLHLVFTEKSNQGFSKLIKDILLGNTCVALETVNKTIDGKEFDILIKFKVLDENLENVIITTEDISDRVRIREKLAESELRYKEAQTISKLGNWTYDFISGEIFWSDEVFRIVGIDSKIVVPNFDFYLSLIHHEDKQQVTNYSIETLLENKKQHIVYRIITPQKELKYISEHRSVIIKNGRIEKITGTSQDITERVSAENKLNYTKTLLTDTISGIKEGFVLLDENFNYLYINQNAAEFVGRQPEELIGKNIWEESPELKEDVLYQHCQTVLKEKRSISFENNYKPWKKWFESRILPSNNGIVITFHEITEKVLAQNRIKQAYNIINKSSSVAFLCKNMYDFPVVFGSENSADLFGFTNEEFIKGDVKIYEIVHPNDLPEIAQQVFDLLKSEKSTTIKPEPFRIVTKQKVIKWVKANIDVIRNDEGHVTHVQGIVEDYSDRKRVEDDFYKSNQRIKDQFNNTPLASIITDNNFEVVEWNNSAKRIFGFSQEEVIGKNLGELIIPANEKERINSIKESLLNQTGGYRSTNENITKSGEIIICDWYNVTLKDADENVIGIACLGDDITERNNSKQLLIKSERRYRDLFEKSFDAVMILKDNHFVDCNEAMLKMFCYQSKDELLSVHPSEISPEYQKDGEISFKKAEDLMSSTMENGSSRFRWFHKRKNGQVFLCDVTLTRIEDIDNIPTIHTVIKDISAEYKKELLETVLYNISKAALSIEDFNDYVLFIKNELHQVINTDNFYITLYDESSDMIKVVFMVDAQEDCTEFPAEGSLTGLVIKSNKPMLVNQAIHNQLIEKGKAEIVGVESKIWLGAPLKLNDKAIGAIVVQSYEDEHAYKEEDLQLLEFVADQISISIQRKNAQDELKNALLKAQESDKLKSSFLANMSHEIRTPMNGIIGFSELMLNSKISDQDRHKYANIVVNSSKQLLTIVNDILDISKIEAGVVKLNYQSTCINKLIDDIYWFYKPIADENNLELICKKGLDSTKSTVEIDSAKLQQVFTNLLSNAFKFTNEGSIEFGYSLQGNYLQFYIKDTGIGIDKELQLVIFDRFIQAQENFQKQSKGTGLGLAISKKFIELFEGEIWVNSSETGTIFYFTIPYKQSKESPLTSVLMPKQKITPIEHMKMTILIAEDEEYNIMYMNELFSNTTITIIEAANGKEAVDLAKKHPEIELVFMDIKMPVLNGYDAMYQIKEFRPELPIVALSAFAMESDREIALEKGFDGYLTKPIDRKKLFALMSQYATKSI